MTAFGYFATRVLPTVKCKQQRGVDKELPGTENEVEQDLMAWCRIEAGMSQLASGHDTENSRGVIINDIDEEDEVEAMGECDIFEIQHQYLASLTLVPDLITNY